MNATRTLLAFLCILVVCACPVGAQYPDTLKHTLLNPGPSSGDYFGRAVAVSGTRVVVGAFLDNNGASNAGRAYVYDLASASPTVPSFILNNPSPAVDDYFGVAVAISGTRVVIGASSDDLGATDAGSAYVYDLAGPTPTVPVAVLPNPSPASHDDFGLSVAIDGARVVVGAYRDDTGAIESGSVYIYDLTSVTPTVPVTTLVNPTPGDSDFFGFTVGISGTRVVAGAHGYEALISNAGIAYVYDLASATPTVPVVVLNNPSSPSIDDYFGVSVAISGTRVAVGAFFDDFGATHAGSAYVYDLAGATPTVPVATLHNPSPAENDNFGVSVAISGTRVLVGAFHDGAGAMESGSAYVYDLVSSTPTAPVATLNNPTPAASDWFGYALAIDDATVVVGAPLDNSGATDAGAAYIFAPNTTEPPTLTAPADGTTTTSPIMVTYTLPEAALAGSVQIKFHDFAQSIEVFITPDVVGHTAGPHTLSINPATPGVSPGVAATTGGPIFNGKYSVILSYQDTASNPAAFDFNLNVTVDYSTGAPTLSLPLGGATYTGTVPVDFQLPEAALYGSVKLVFQSTASPTTVSYTLSMSQETMGSHSFTIDPLDPTASPEIATGGPLAGGTYTVRLQYQDALGNSSAEAIQSPVTVVVPLPEVVTTLIYTKGGALPTAGVDPNIPAGAVWHAFGIPAIDDAGKVAFVAKWKNPAGSPLGSYGTGVFVDGALRVYAGQEVAGIAGTTFKKFRDPVISSDHLALLATIEGAAITNANDTVVIRVRPTGEVTALAQEGISGTFPTAAAGVDGATIKSFKSVDISGGSVATGPSGILYTATLNQGSGLPAVTSTTDYAAWLFRNDVTSLVVREGATATGLAPGETVKSFTLLKTISGSSGQRRGHAEPQLVNFFTKLSTGRQALLDHFAGLTGTTRLTGETVGGGSFPAATWKSFGTLADNAEDAYAMKAVITGGGVPGSGATGIFYTVGSPDDTWENVAFIGDDAGGGTTFQAFKDPVLQGSGGINVAFGTTLVDGGGVKSSAIYWTPGAVPVRLASQGTAAPGGGTFGKFTSLAYPGGGIGPVLLASLALGVDGIDKSNDVGLWVTDSSGTLHKAVREGDVIGGKTIKTLTVLKTVSGSPGTTHAFNANGAIVSRASFTDGSSGILKTTVP